MHMGCLVVPCDRARRRRCQKIFSITHHQTSICLPVLRRWQIDTSLQSVPSTYYSNQSHSPGRGLHCKRSQQMACPQYFKLATCYQRDWSEYPSIIYCCTLTHLKISASSLAQVSIYLKVQHMHPLLAIHPRNYFCHVNKAAHSIMHLELTHQASLLSRDPNQAVPNTP